MPTFEYQAQAQDGQLVNGLVFGMTMDHALRDLGSKGLQIMRIGVAANPNDPLSAVAAPAPRPVEHSSSEVASAEVDPSISNPDSPYATTTSTPMGDMAPPVEQRSYIARAVWGPVVGKVALDHLAFFFRQGATMFAAGVPIVQALTTLSNQSSSPKLKGIIKETAEHVKAGRPISAGLQRYPEVFSPVIVSLIRAGEEGGFLDEAMATVADYLDREIVLRNLYKRVTFMPKLTVITSILIIVGANLIIDRLGGSEKLWSPLTQVSTWFILTPIIIGLFLFLRIGLANPAVKYIWDTVISNIPYLGTTMRQLSMAKFGRAFGALYRGGVPMVKALQLSADACGNEFLRARMYPAYKGLERGSGVTETFRATHAFNPIVMDMVHTGETTGNLDHMLNKVAEYYEGEAEVRSHKTGQVVGVALVILVAVYIGYVVINFYSQHYGNMMKSAE